MAELLCDVMTVEPNTKIVALPTIQKHIRERGFDHMQKLANYVAKMAGVETVQALIRGNNAVQVGASMEKRQEQAGNKGRRR